MRFATKPFDISRLTLGMLLHYFGKLKIQIFCRYSAHMEENVNNQSTQGPKTFRGHGRWPA